MESFDFLDIDSFFYMLLAEKNVHEGLFLPLRHKKDKRDLFLDVGDWVMVLAEQIVETFFCYNNIDAIIM
jgi:hypothetical protein